MAGSSTSRLQAVLEKMSVLLALDVCRQVHTHTCKMSVLLGRVSAAVIYNSTEHVTPLASCNCNRNFPWELFAARLQSEFTRTPKYGEGTAVRRTRAVRYPPIRSILPAVEILFALYFSFCTWNAVESGAWTSVPFLLLFLVGFSYVSAKSIGFWIQQMSMLVPPPEGAIAET